MPRLTPRRIVALGILLLALSGVGFAVVDAMRPPNRTEEAAMNRIAERWAAGEFNHKEFFRQIRAFNLGINGWILTPRAYRDFRVLVFGTALAGLALIAAGAIRARQPSIATPPGS